MMAAISLTEGIPISSILQGFVTVLPAEDIVVTGVAIDSRQVQPGDLFIAYREGANFMDEAITAGASAIVADTDNLSKFRSMNIPVFNVTALHCIAGKIISRFYDNPSSKLKVIGVTGTNGKTSVSYLLAQVLSTVESKCGLFGTLGYGTIDELEDGITTTPDPVTLQRLLFDMQAQRLRYAVMEVSSHSLDQGRVTGVDFDMGIFTNLSQDHLDYHRNIENYANIKQQFFTDYSLNKAVINLDDVLGKSILSRLDKKVDAVAYSLVEDLDGLPGLKTPLVAGKLNSDPANGLVIDLKTPWGQGVLNTSLTGNFNVNNLLACIGALCLLDMPFEDAIRRLSVVKPVPGRMECFGGKTQPLIVVDYAHTPDALKQVLHSLKLQCKGKLFCVFGCGGNRDKGKRPAMGKIAEQYADVIYLTNDNPRFEDPEIIIQDILNGIDNKKSIIIEMNREAAIENAVNSAARDDIVLIAGKGHEKYQEIKSVKNKFSDQEIVSGLLRLVE